MDFKNYSKRRVGYNPKALGTWLGVTVRISREPLIDLRLSK
jgi:hypothetical protein